jgi:hypothetical protein
MEHPEPSPEYVDSIINSMTPLNKGRWPASAECVRRRLLRVLAVDLDIELILAIKYLCPSRLGQVFGT